MSTEVARMYIKTFSLRHNFDLGRNELQNRKSGTHVVHDLVSDNNNNNNNNNSNNNNNNNNWWPAGYRGTPKIFRYTGKILPVASLLQSAFSVSISGQH